MERSNKGEAVCRHHGRSLAQRRTRGQGHWDFHEHRNHPRGPGDYDPDAVVPLIHLGMVFVGTPYGQNPQILVTDGIGGSPYGPGTLAGTDGSRQPVEADHNRTQPRQSPCSRRELSQKPQGKLGGTITIGT
jgi:hypothetical protein